MISQQQQKNVNYDWLIRILIIGDSGVGKTNVLVRFSDNSFKSTHLPTLGIDFKIKTIEVEGKKIKIQIWDTAGQEKFNTITQTYYKGAQGIILAYAINDKQSFDSIEKWVRQIKQHAQEGICKMLIGNKCDIFEDRKITFEQGQALADELGVPFLETSAKDGINVDEAFYSLAKNIKHNVLESSNQTEETSKLQQQNVYLQSKNKKKKNKKTNCC